MEEKKDYKLFLSLILWALVPSIYMLIRMQIVSVNNVDINILGQMEWFDLINEVLVTTLTVPLYYLLKPDKSNKARAGIAFLVSFLLYEATTAVLVVSISNIAGFMNAPYAETYLLWQCISMLVGFTGTFMVMLFTLHSDFKTVYTLLILRTLFLVMADCILIQRFGDLGSVYSEITVNAIIAVASLWLAVRHGYIGFERCSDYGWMKEWVRIGAFAGIQIFLDNYIYAVMICRMVNEVQESGNYWIANNFIWGWLLVPVTCMAEIIKKNSLEKLDFKNTWRFAIGIAAVWLISVPGWHWFITNAMASDADIILKIVYPSAVFYLTYIVSAFIDAWFVSRGRTEYLTIISLLVNIVYYGIIYILFRNGIFTANMTFIVIMFGCGMIVHLILSVVLYFLEKCRTLKTAAQQSIA